MATTDIFNRKAIEKITSKKAEDMSITFSGSLKQDGLYVQQLQYSYAQQANRLFDLTDPSRMLYIAARPQGQLSINHIVADGRIVGDFVQKLADPCKVLDNNISVDFNNDSCDSKGQKGTLTFKNCLLASIGISQSVADYVINDSIQIMFSHLETTK